MALTVYIAKCTQCTFVAQGTSSIRALTTDITKHRNVSGHTVAAGVQKSIVMSADRVALSKVRAGVAPLEPLEAYES